MCVCVCVCVIGMFISHNYLKLLEKYIINKIQQDATIYRYLFTAKLLYMFRVSSHPSSGAHKNVAAASGTGHGIRASVA